MHNNIVSVIIQQILNVGRGMRIASGMLAASLRSGYTICVLLCLNAVFLLHYYDVIMRILFAGGSPIAWAIMNLFKRRGFPLPLHVFGVEWALHLPEHFIFFALMALFSLIMMHIVNNNLEGRSCGMGRAFFRAVRSWRFIVLYAFCMSCIAWSVGDVHLNCVRWALGKIYETPILIESLYEPIYGKKVLEIFLATPYWLSTTIRVSLAGIWYVGTFLIFPIVAAEQCSFFYAVRRSFGLALQNIGLVLSAALFDLIMYAGVIIVSLYGQVATFPSLEGLDMKSSVQVIVLFSFMALILFTVHSALVTSGSLITAALLYRICTKQRMPAVHAFSIDRPYWSSFLYLIFYFFYWIIIRCGIHVQMPNL